MMGPLEHLRVVDLTDSRGTLAGYLLASLGADVVTVEVPGSGSARDVRPWSRDEASLFWTAYGRGKRSVVVDTAAPDGLRVLERLAASADVLLETGLASAIDEANLDNDRLIRVSISPFGLSGPKAMWPATDLTLAASAGQMFLTGDPDRAPLRISVDQVYFHACLEAVGATLIALYEREHHSGLGQHVDVSAQEAFLLASQCQMLGHPLNGRSAQRNGGGSKVGPISIRFVFACLDGFVVLTVAFGPAIGRFVQRLMEWICEEGVCDAATRDKDWVGYGMLLLNGEEPLSEWDRVQQVVADFCARKTKAELLEAALQRHLAIAPVATVPDILANAHFQGRGCFDVEEGLQFPGRFATFTRSPLQPLRRAPMVGEHTDEVLHETSRERRPAARGASRRDGGAALEGLKVLDFMWVMAGPAGSRVLADYGATVVRVESATRVDAIRTLSPFRDNTIDPEFSAPYNNVNAGKLGLSLDLSKPESREVVYDLVRWADVVLESFSPGAFARAGFSYETLATINPSIIVLSTSLLGQTGPHAALAGYGTMAAAVAGFTNITGWPDRAPAGPFSAYTDTTSPRFLAISVLAALEYRRRTGVGQY
jgi:crotonobetainyl-CoA:carnitine CoA-transferase CaiB-like acyl-CoA transferase